MKGDPSSTSLSAQFCPKALFMMDTVRCYFPTSAWRRNYPKGWTRNQNRHDCGGSEECESALHTFENIMLSDRESGLRVAGDKFGARWFEVSMPRFANRDNSILIMNDKDLEQAKQGIERAINLVCEFDAKSANPRVTRLDLVQYLNVLLKDAMTAHQSSRHPKFHKTPGRYLGESLVFKGRLRMFRIYDSNLLKTGLCGNSTRFEWQLRTSALTRDFGQVVLWDELTINECYRVFRELSLGFECSSKPRIDSIYGLLAIAIKNDWQHDGISALDIYLQNKSKTTANRIVRKITALQPEIFKFDWNRFLPPTFAEFKAPNTSKPTNNRPPCLFNHELNSNGRRLLKRPERFTRAQFTNEKMTNSSSPGECWTRYRPNNPRGNESCPRL